MVASAASDVRLQDSVVIQSHKTWPRRGVVWIIVGICAAAWSIDAVLAWTATEVLPAQVIPANAAHETSTPQFALSRWRKVALQARGAPGTQFTGTLVRLDGQESHAIDFAVGPGGKATAFLEAPQRDGTFLLQLQAQHNAADTTSPSVAVHQGLPGAHTAWWFYGFNAIAILIVVVGRLSQKMGLSRTT